MSGTANASWRRRRAEAAVPVQDTVADLAAGFRVAEQRRAEGQTAPALVAYGAVTSAATVNRAARHDRLELRLGQAQRRLRRRLGLVLALLAAIAAGGLWLALASRPAPPPVPQELALVRWLAWQQAVALLRQLRAQLPEDGSAALDKELARDPWSLVERYGARCRSGSECGGPRVPPPQGSGRAPTLPAACSYPLHCRPEDLPTVPGEFGDDAFTLISTMRKTGLVPTDCGRLGAVVETISRRFGWRDGERARAIKTYLEQSLTVCFSRAGDHRQDVVHAERALCSGSAPSQIMNLNNLAWISMRAGDRPHAEAAHACTVAGLGSDKPDDRLEYQNTTIIYALEAMFAALWGDQATAVSLFDEALRRIETRPRATDPLTQARHLLVMEAFLMGRAALADTYAPPLDTLAQVYAHPGADDSDWAQAAVLDLIYRLRTRAWTAAGSASTAALGYLEATRDYRCHLSQTDVTIADLTDTLAQRAPPAEADRQPQYQKLGAALGCGRLERAARLDLVREVAAWIEAQR